MMKKTIIILAILIMSGLLISTVSAYATGEIQLPCERGVVTDPVTGEIIMHYETTSCRQVKDVQMFPEWLQFIMLKYNFPIH